MWAVEQDATGDARGIALAYGRAIGCGRAGLIASSFAEEAEADLFNEQAVVWGGVPELLIAGFETLVAGGVSPEVAYLECVGELKLIAELIEERGIAGMREAISNTAELGALLGGQRIVDAVVRERMAEVLAEVRAGRFADELRPEEAERLRAAGESARRSPRNAPRSDVPTAQRRGRVASADRLRRGFRPLADARPFEIGALQLAMRFGRLPGLAAPWASSCSSAARRAK